MVLFVRAPFFTSRSRWPASWPCFRPGRGAAVVRKPECGGARLVSARGQPSRSRSKNLFWPVTVTWPAFGLKISKKKKKNGAHLRYNTNLLVDCCHFSTDLVTTIFANRLMTVFFPLPLPIFQRLSSAFECHPAFGGSWPNLQLLGDLDLGQAAVHHAHSATAHR